MGWIIAAATVVLVLGIAAVAASGALSGMSRRPSNDVPAFMKEHGVLTAQDLDNVRFNVARAGYEVSQVDALLDRLRHEIAMRDDLLARNGLSVQPDQQPGSPIPGDLDS